MTDPDTSRTPRPEETDWGKKLKEFMERTPDEADTPDGETPNGTPRPLTAEKDTAFDDELEALLRAQLAPRPRPAVATAADGDDRTTEPVEVKPVCEEAEMDAGEESAPEPAEATVPPSEKPPVGTDARERPDVGQPERDESEIGTDISAGIQAETEAETVPESLDKEEAPEQDDSRSSQSSPSPVADSDAGPVPAPDDVLNGLPMSSLLTSAAFLNGLDEVARRQVLAIIQADQPPEATDPVAAAPEDAGTATEKQEDSAPPVEAEDEAAPPSQEAVGGSDSDREEPDPLADLPLRHPGPRRKTAPTRNRTYDDPMQISLDSTFRLVDSASATGEDMTAGDDAEADDIAQPESKDSQTPREEVDRNDRDDEMYLRLGYEEELRATAAGAARADRAKRKVTRRERVGTRNAIPAAYRGKEYSGRRMTAQVDATYRRTLMGDVVRLSLAVLGLLVGLLYDLLPLVASGNLSSGGAVPALMDFTGSIGYSLCGLAILILFSLPCMTRLVLGLRSLWDFEPVPFAAPALALVVGLINGILSCFTVGREALSTAAPGLFCGGVLAILSMTCLCDLLSDLAERQSFRAVSSGKARFVMTRELSARSPELSGEAEEAGTDSQPSRRDAARTLYVHRALGVSDFFTWANRYQARLGLLNYFLPLVLLLAILCGGLYAVWGGDVLTGVPRVFTAVFLCCLPGAYLLSLSLPHFLGNRMLAEKGCTATVIGKATPDIYVPPLSRRRGTRILMADGSALRAVSPNIITVRGDPQADAWRAMACKLFILLDSALAESDMPVRQEELDNIRVELAESGEQFLRLYMTDTRRDETVEVMAGTHEALTQQGVALPSVSREASFRKTANAQVMYLAFDRRFRMACAVEYRLQLSFARAVRKLDSLGCRVSLVSYDPLVSPSSLSSPGASPLPPLELIHPRQYSELYALRSGGLIASEKGTDIFLPYMACHRMRKAFSRGALLSWLALPLSAAVCLLLSLQGVDGATLSAFAVLWQLLLGGLSTLSVALTVTRQSLEPTLRAKAPSRTGKSQKS